MNNATVAWVGMLETMEAKGGTGEAGKRPVGAGAAAAGGAETAAVGPGSAACLRATYSAWRRLVPML